MLKKEPVLQQEPSQAQPRRDRDWQTVALCIDKDSGFCVEVRQDKACPWPKFSLRVGRKRDDQDHVALFIPVMVDRHQCTIKGPSPSAVLPALLAKAETFVLAKQAEYELEREHEGRVLEAVARHVPAQEVVRGDEVIPVVRARQARVPSEHRKPQGRADDCDHRKGDDRVYARQSRRGRPRLAHVRND